MVVIDGYRIRLWHEQYQFLGPPKAAETWVVSKAAIHKWIDRRSVTLFKHPLRLSCSSWIPIEELDGDEDSES